MGNAPDLFSLVCADPMSDPSSRRVLQATGQSVAHICFDTERTRMMRREERQHLAYHIGRLVSGERTAAMEWEHFGIDLEAEADSDGGP